VKLNVSISILLLSFLLIGFSVETWVLNQYLFDNADFTEKFCENKTKPELKCNGSCAMKKVLQIDINTEENNSPEKERVEKQDFKWYFKIAFSSSHFIVNQSGFVTFLIRCNIGINDNPDNPPETFV